MPAVHSLSVFRSAYDAAAAVNGNWLTALQIWPVTFAVLAINTTELKSLLFVRPLEDGD
jgi:hypothetical protein